VCSVTHNGMTRYLNAYQVCLTRKLFVLLKNNVGSVRLKLKQILVTLYSHFHFGKTALERIKALMVLVV